MAFKLNSPKETMLLFPELWFYIYYLDYILIYSQSMNIMNLITHMYDHLSFCYRIISSLYNNNNTKNNKSNNNNNNNNNNDNNNNNNQRKSIRYF